MEIFDSKMTNQKIFNLTREKGWSDAKFAGILGVTPQAVSKWRRDLNTPGIDMLFLIAGVLGVEVYDILGTTKMDIQINEA